MRKTMKRVAVIVLSLSMVFGASPAITNVSASQKTSAIKSKSNDNGDVFDFSKAFF